MNKRLYAASILSAAALWGCIGVFLRGMTDLGLSSMQAMSARTVFAAAVLLPVLWLRDRSLLRLERLSDLRYFFGTGILSLLFFNWCYFGAIKASSMSVAAVLLYTSPIFVVLLSAACFGERITRCKALALCCTFAGCALVSGLLSQGEGIGMRAFLLGIGSGFGYSLYSIFGRFALRRYRSLTVTFYTICFAAAGSVLITLLSGEQPLPALLFTGRGIFLTFGMAVLCCALPYLLYTAGLAGVQAGHAAIMATLEPVVAAVLGVGIFREAVTPSKLAGMALVLISVALLARDR